jgi:heptosyltransferase-2
MAVPALREVRRLLSAAQISLLMKPQVAGLFRGADFVDEIIQGDLRSTRDYLATAAQLRSRRYDLALLLPNSFSSALLVFAARIPIRVGYATDGRSVLLTHAIPPNAELKREHQVYYYLSLVSEVEKLFNRTTTGSLTDPTPRLVVSPLRQADALEFLRASGVDVSKKLVVLNPGAVNSRAKQWLPERFAAVGDGLLERGDTSVVIIGTQAELVTAEEVRRRMRASAVVLAGRTSLDQLVALLSCAHLLISNDTGAAHIGPAVGVPTIVIFGPTEDFATRPFSEKAMVIKKPVECAPCMLRECPIDHRCMTGVRVEDVLHPAFRILDEAIICRV